MNYVTNFKARMLEGVQGDGLILHLQRSSSSSSGGGGSCNINKVQNSRENKRWQGKRMHGQ